MPVRIYDRNGAERDWAWLRARFGNVTHYVSNAPRTLRLVRIDVRAGPATLCATVLDKNGMPLANGAVAEAWPAADGSFPNPDLPLLDPAYVQRKTPRAIVQQTTANGVTDFPYGKESYAHLPGGGPFMVWAASRVYDADVLANVGWINDHETPNPVFQLVEDGAADPTVPGTTDLCKSLDAIRLELADIADSLRDLSGRG